MEGSKEGGVEGEEVEVRIDHGDDGDCSGWFRTIDLCRLGGEGGKDIG